MYVYNRNNILISTVMELSNKELEKAADDNA